MELQDKLIVVTGAASGIGRALAQRFAAEKARLIVCADINAAGADDTAKTIGGVTATTDVSKESDIAELIDAVERDHGPIDLSAPMPVSELAAVPRPPMHNGSGSGTSTSWPMSGPRAISFPA